MSEAISVENRDLTGTRNNRRLRRSGYVPAILYGHGLENVSLKLREHDLAAAIRHGSRVVDLTGAANESALIRAVAWDTFGLEILHVDFTRVSADERIEVKVPIELKGQSPGVKEGGVIELLIHEVEIECPALKIPDKLVLSINELKIDDSLTTSDLALPEGVVLRSREGEVVVHCVMPKAEEEAAPEVAAPGEPEVIGRKPEEGEAEE
jgi:large subunit ribosomal protein L25